MAEKKAKDTITKVNMKMSVYEIAKGLALEENRPVSNYIETLVLKAAKKSK